MDIQHLGRVAQKLGDRLHLAGAADGVHLVAEDGGIWLFPQTGGKPVALDSFKSANTAAIHSIKPGEGLH